VGKGAHYTIERVCLSLWLSLWFAARVNFLFWGFWLMYREGENSAGLQRNPGKCVDVYLFRESFMWWVLTALLGLLWLSQRPFHRPYLRASTKEVLFHEDSTAVSVKDSLKRGIHGAAGEGVAHGDEVSAAAYKMRATDSGLEQNVDTRMQNKCLRLWKVLNPTRKENKKYLRIMYAAYIGLVMGLLFESREEGRPCVSLRQIDACLELGLSNGECFSCECAPPAVYERSTDGCVGYSSNQTATKGTVCYRGFLPHESMTFGIVLAVSMGLAAVVAHIFNYAPVIDFLSGVTRKRMWKAFSVVPRLRYIIVY
jgi:hypothetical protein